MTFSRHQCSKLMSRDMGLIGLLRFLPLVQFTKAQPVDSLGPFSLASLETGFVMAPDCQRPAVEPCTHQNDARMDSSPYASSSPCAPLESPRHSGATDEGMTPRLLWMSLPCVPEDRRPTEM